MSGKLFLFAVALLPLVGCGGESSVKTVDVSGEVKLDGKPLPGAEVKFVSDKHVGVGTTDASGGFTLKNGAAPGENKITVSKITDPKYNPEEGMDAEMLRMEGQAQGLRTAKGESLPLRYSVLGQSNLTFDVPADGTEEATLELKSK